MCKTACDLGNGLHTRCSVMCSIDQQNDLADHVREQVLNRQLPDLSLSHSYEVFMTDDKVALLKSPIEVSVCSMGARDGERVTAED